MYSTNFKIFAEKKGPQGPRNILKCYKHRTEAVGVIAITTRTVEIEQPCTRAIPQETAAPSERIVQRWKVRVVAVPAR